MARSVLVGSAVLGSLLAGAAAAYSPVVAGVVGGLALAAVALVFAPFFSLGVGVLSGSVSPEFLSPLEPYWSALYRGHRLLILLTIFALLAHRGLRDAKPPPTIAAYGVVLLLTFTLAAPPQGLSPDKALFALLTLNIGWLATHIRWHDEERHRILQFVATVPLVSVATGFALEAGGVHLSRSVDYTGVPRLHGAGIAAYLALMATGGAAASVLLYRLGRRRMGVSLVLSNFVIVALTATRGGVLATAILLVPFAVTVALRGDLPVGQVAFRALGALVLFVAVAIFFVPPLLARSFHSGEAGFESSGRIEAWSYFLDQTKGHAAFGRGLGSAVLLAEAAEDLPGDFRGVHNDVLRLYVECGVVGGALIVLAVALVLRRAYQLTPRALRGDLLALLAAFLFYSFVDNTLSTFQFFLPLGLVLGVYASLGTSSALSDENTELA